jgi:hypothetical protein
MGSDSFYFTFNTLLIFPLSRKILGLSPSKNGVSHTEGGGLSHTDHTGVTQTAKVVQEAPLQDG